MADITKTVKWLLVGDDKSATKALKNTGKGFRDAVKSADGFNGKAKVLGGAIAGVGVAAAVAGAAIAVKFGQDSVEVFKKTAGEVAKLARVTGESTEDASRLAFALKQSGIDAGAGAKSLSIFSKNVVKMAETDKAGKVAAAAKADAIRDQIAALKAAGPSSAGYTSKMAALKDKLALATAGTKLNASALGDLGVQYTDTNGKMLPMSKLLPKVADKFAAMPDGPQKTALAMKLFGKAGVDMLPFLNKGAAGLAELAAKSDKFGNTIGDKQLKALKDSKQAQRDWDAAMQGLQVTLGGSLLPLLTKGAQFLNQAVIPAFQGMAQWVGENQEMFDALGNMMRWVWNNVMIPLLKVAISGWSMQVRVIGQAVEALGRLTGNKDMEKFGAGVARAADGAQDFANKLEGIPDSVVPTVGLTDTASPKAVALKAKMDTLKDKIIKAEAKGDTTEVDRLQGKLNKVERKYNAEIHVKKTGVTTIGFQKSSGGDRISVIAKATGGWANGLTLVGEYGPEILSLRRPMHVTTAAQSARMVTAASGAAASSAGVSINLAVTVQGDADPLGAAKRIEQKLVELLRARGGGGLAFAR